MPALVSVPAGFSSQSNCWGVVCRRWGPEVGGLSARTSVDLGLGLGDSTHDAVQHAKVLRKETMN